LAVSNATSLTILAIISIVALAISLLLAVRSAGSVPVAAYSVACIDFTRGSGPTGLANASGLGDRDESSKVSSLALSTWSASGGRTNIELAVRTGEAGFAFTSRGVAVAVPIAAGGVAFFGTLRCLQRRLSRAEDWRHVGISGACAASSTLQELRAIHGSQNPSSIMLGTGKGWAGATSHDKLDHVRGPAISDDGIREFDDPVLWDTASVGEGNAIFELCAGKNWSCVPLHAAVSEVGAREQHLPSRHEVAILIGIDLQVSSRGPVDIECIDIETTQRLFAEDSLMPTAIKSQTWRVYASVSTIEGKKPWMKAIDDTLESRWKHHAVWIRCILRRQNEHATMCISSWVSSKIDPIVVILYAPLRANKHVLGVADGSGASFSAQIAVVIHMDMKTSSRKGAIFKYDCGGTIRQRKGSRTLKGVALEVRSTTVGKVFGLFVVDQIQTIGGPMVQKLNVGHGVGADESVVIIDVVD
jgi:hypothetical protein